VIAYSDISTRAAYRNVCCTTAFVVFDIVPFVNHNAARPEREDGLRDLLPLPNMGLPWL